MDFPASLTGHADAGSSHLLAQSQPCKAASPPGYSQIHMGMSCITACNINFSTLKIPLHYHQVMNFLQAEESSFLPHLCTAEIPHQQYWVVCRAVGENKCFLCSSSGLFPVQLSPRLMCLLRCFYLHNFSHSFTDSSRQFGPVKMVSFVTLTRWKPWGHTGCAGGKPDTDLTSQRYFTVKIPQIFHSYPVCLQRRASCCLLKVISPCYH